MKRKNAARSALFTSIISLLLCVSMLVGTTFAWFTDEVKSGNNLIAAGNLDIELDYAILNDDGTVKEWKTVSGTDELFDKNALWEPGHTEVAYLRLSNAGTLALEYQLGINITETSGTNVFEEQFKLSDYIYMGVAEGIQPSFGSREEAIDEAKKGVNAKIGEGYFKPGTMEADAQDLYMAVVVYMPETVDNNANHLTGTDAPVITLGINLFATQLDSEEDSFGKDYDEGAEMPKIYDHVVSTFDDLKEAIKTGGSIQLAGDIELDGLLDIQPGIEVELDMNGKTLSVASNVDYAFIVKEGGSLTIDGNGTVETTPTTIMFYPSGNLTIENGTFVRNVPEDYTGSVRSMFVGTKPDGGWESTGVVINGGYFDSGYYNQDAADVEAILAGKKDLEETENDVAKRGVAGDKNKVRVAIKENVTKAFNRSNNYFKIYGGTFVGANPAWGDEGCMLPTEQNYLRPWSYYQGALLDGQNFNKDGIVLPAGYTITHSTAADGRPVYTVSYSK